MSSLSFHNASIAALDRWMGNLDYLLKKGQAHADGLGIDHSAFLQARLFPDMKNLIGQVQLATAITKACPHRIIGSEPPVYEDTELSFDDLYARIAKTRAELAKFTPANIDGLEGREFSVKLGPSLREFTALSYASGFTLPNVLFHVTTAYNILRHNGVPIGKFDFFGGG